MIQDGVATTMTAAATTGSKDLDDDETPGCRLYKFVVLTNVGGLIIIFGFVGNLIAFLVFQRDSMKTSTSFLFQVLLLVALVDYFLLFIFVHLLSPCSLPTQMLKSAVYIDVESGIFDFRFLVVYVLHHLTNIRINKYQCKIVINTLIML